MGAMSEMENITVWLSLANTVFASIAFVIWYFAIWQEDEEKFDAKKVLIVDDQNHEISDKDENHGKYDTVNSDTDDEDVKSNDDKHLYVKPSLRTGDNMLNYHDYCCYYQNTIKHETADVKDAQDDIKHTKYVRAANAESKVVENANTKDKMVAEVIKDPSAQLDMKTTLAVPAKATFQWPKHENTIEQLRAGKEQSRGRISQEVQDTLESLGIMRDSTARQNVGMDSIKVSDSARLSAKLIGKKQVRITWDNFMAKSRPGLKLDSDSPRQRKPQNYQRKNKNAKQSKPDNAGKQTSSFIRTFKTENCINLVRVV